MSSSNDSENMDILLNNGPDDITSLFSCIGVNTFKISFLLFILFIIISSDVFVECVLARGGKSYIEGRHPSTSGVIAQGVIL